MNVRNFAVSKRNDTREHGVGNHKRKTFTKHKTLFHYGIRNE